HEEGKRPSEISRKDEIMTAPNGLVSIAGGKLTTHRRMAERVVDLVVERLGGAAGPCRTDSVALPNGELASDALAALTGTLVERIPGLDTDGAERLVRLYGAGCRGILARIAANATAGEDLGGGLLRAEIEQALDDEMALTLEDLL